MILHVILDRDGTLIRHIPYLCDPSQVQLLPGVAEGLQRLKRHGCMIYLHTNQSGVGRGYFSMDEVVACNERMIALLPHDARAFTEICIAPENPENASVFRKPSAAFGKALMARYGFRVHEVCYVGDALTDLLTAQNLGCFGIGVNTGENNLREIVKDNKLKTAFPVVESFLDAVELIVRISDD